jgi:four helix bundle protein
MTVAGSESEFLQWESTVPRAFRQDSLWKVQGYRLSLFLADVAWSEVMELAKDRRTTGLADQLYRAVGSIGANIAEGYSRGTGRDRARFYEYALGSARESRDWYYKARLVLGLDVVAERLDLLSQIIRLLVVIVPAERKHSIQEESEPYELAISIDSTPTNMQ